MNPAGVQWTPAIAVVVVGLLAGLALMLFLRRRTAAAVGSTLPARDLEGRIEALVRQLRELDFQDAKRNPEQLAQERQALELAAARAWRDLDGLPPDVVPAAPVVVTPAAPPSAFAGFAWGAGSMAALGLLIFFVSQAAAPREEGGQMTGNLPDEATKPPMGAVRPPAVADPANLEARLDTVRQSLMQQDMMGVFNETKAILEKWPGEPRALAYQAVVRLAMGQADRAEAMLKQAIAAAPDLIDARIHLMLVYAETGRMKEAEAVYNEAVQRYPDRAGQLKSIYAEIQKREAAPNVAAAADAHAAVGAPPAAAADGKRIAGMLELDPAVSAVNPRAVVFVMVREAGFGAGPPLAARRLPVAAFPMRFEIGSADSMRGEPLPDTLLVEARIDSDGDPITRPPTDPYARVDDVKSGTTDVRLVLKPRS